jgi:hypothetical protein
MFSALGAALLEGIQEPVLGIRIGVFLDFSRRNSAQRRVGAAWDRMSRNPFRPRIPISRPGGVFMDVPPFELMFKTCPIPYFSYTTTRIAKSRKKWRNIMGWRSLFSIHARSQIQRDMMSYTTGDWSVLVECNPLKFFWAWLRRHDSSRQDRRTRRLGELGRQSPVPLRLLARAR